MKNCPKCNSENIYQDQDLWICPECFHECFENQEVDKAAQDSKEISTVKDAHGNILNDGDSVILIKDLKIKGSSASIKGGTKVRNIRIQDAGDGHNISCKIEGHGAINLKSEFVRKA